MPIGRIDRRPYARLGCDRSEIAVMEPSTPGCSTYTAEIQKPFPVLTLRGGRDLKMRPPAGQARTAADSNGQDAENRGLAGTVIGPDRPEENQDRQSVSAHTVTRRHPIDARIIHARYNPTHRIHIAGRNDFRTRRGHVGMADSGNRR